MVCNDFHKASGGRGRPGKDTMCTCGHPWGEHGKRSSAPVTIKHAVVEDKIVETKLPLFILDPPGWAAKIKRLNKHCKARGMELIDNSVWERY